MKTLNEVVEIVGLTRRMIQEYERTGLATTPETKNKYGHLLYSEKDIEHLMKIRFYRELGYDKNKIRGILKDPDHDKMDALRKELEALDRKRARLTAMMQTETAAMELGIPAARVRQGSLDIRNIKYQDAVPLLDIILGSRLDIFSNEDFYTEQMTESENEQWFRMVESILKLRTSGMEETNPQVQEKIWKLHNMIEKEISDSIYSFAGVFMAMSPETEIGKDLDSEYGEGSSEFLFKAVLYYCEQHHEHHSDKKMQEVAARIESLWEKGYQPADAQVQQEVKAIHQYYQGIQGIHQEAQLQILMNLGSSFRRAQNALLIEKESDWKTLEFMGKAIEIYCEKLHNKMKDKGENENEESNETL